MNLIKSKFHFLILTFFWTFAGLSAQSEYHLSFQGMLSDIEGEKISNAQFDLRVQLKHNSNPEAVFESLSSVSTDQEGWFTVNIEDISSYYLEDGLPGPPLLIKFEFLANDYTSWIGQNEGFMVSYTLKPFLKENKLELEMIRLEGSSLIAHSEDHFYVFKDQIPFAYLSGGFLIVDQYPPDQQLIRDLKEWITPSMEEEPNAASRGVKGGFPTGGNFRKKK
jgi:hypothetical protein